ncbi:zf-RING 2 multi-domain protein [Pyrenophora teres f. maculata]|nr:zf-RING 2 multi-domain protein [Pyrenophora teres f. maculata]
MEIPTPVTSIPEPPLLGKRLQRFRWLLHFLHISKLLEVHQPPILLQNINLQRARTLLFEILDQQVSPHGLSPRMRTASTYTWLDLKYEPLLARGVSPWDPQFDERPASQLPNPATETFPEGGDFWAGQPVTDLIRHQRFHVLDGMRRIIYGSQHVDHADAVAKVEWGLEKLWHYMMWMMGHAQYFVYGHNGMQVYKAWNSLDSSQQAKFMQETLTSSTLMTGGSEIETYVDPSEVNLYLEASVFIKNCFYLAPALETFTVSYCKHVLEDRLATDCFTLVSVPNPTDKLLPDNTCPVCLDPYDHDLTRLHSPDQRGDDDEKVALWDLPDDPRVAIKTLCEHAMCLACLKTWIESTNDNSDLCPLCRGDLKPENPAPKLCAALMEEVSWDRLRHAVAMAAMEPVAYAQTLPTLLRDLDDHQASQCYLRASMEMRKLGVAMREWTVVFQAQHASLMAQREDGYDADSDDEDSDDEDYEDEDVGDSLTDTIATMERLSISSDSAPDAPAPAQPASRDPLPPSGDYEELFHTPSPTSEPEHEIVDAYSVADSDNDQVDSDDEDFLPTEHGVLGLQWDEQWGGMDRSQDEADSDDEIF